jgi:hypothetical protein
MVCPSLTRVGPFGCRLVEQYPPMLLPVPLTEAVNPLTFTTPCVCSVASTTTVDPNEFETYAMSVHPMVPYIEQYVGSMLLDVLDSMKMSATAIAMMNMTRP